MDPELPQLPGQVTLSQPRKVLILQIQTEIIKDSRRNRFSLALKDCNFCFICEELGRDCYFEIQDHVRANEELDKHLEQVHGHEPNRDNGTSRNFLLPGYRLKDKAFVIYKGSGR